MEGYKVSRGKYDMKVEQARKERSVAYNSDFQRTEDQRQNSNKFKKFDRHFEDENKSHLDYSSSEFPSENSKTINERKMPAQISSREFRNQAYKKSPESGNNDTYVCHRESRNQAYKKYSPESGNKNGYLCHRYEKRHAYTEDRNRSSRNQNSTSYQKFDKPNELSESSSRQNVKHEAKNSSSGIWNSKLSPKAEKSNEFLTSRDKQNVRYDDSSKNVHGNVSDNSHAHVLTKNNEISTERENICPSSAKSEDHIPFDTYENNEGISFYDLELLDLLFYNLELMHPQQLKNYAFALKEKTLEVISEFIGPVRDELNFLCAITDGTQTDKNQKLISRRMYFIIANAIEENKLTNPYRDNRETQVFEQTENLNLTSRANEFSKLPQYIENIKQVDLESTENTKERNFIVDSREKNNSLDSLTIKPKETTNIPKMIFEDDNMSNVRAAKLIPNNAPLTCDTYSNFSFRNFLYCDVNEMRGSALLRYAFALKEKILRRNFEIHEFIREKLEFCCELTDGSQTEENQKLILERMRYLLYTYLPGNQLIL